MHIPAKCCIPATSLDLQANTILPICGHLHRKQHRIHNGGMTNTEMLSGIGHRNHKQELISEKMQRDLLRIDILVRNILGFHNCVFPGWHAVMQLIPPRRLDFKCPTINSTILSMMDRAIQLQNNWPSHVSLMHIQRK